MSIITPATALPWTLHPNAVGYRPEYAACLIWTPKGPGRGLVATTAPHSCVYENSAPDAAYIVRAANAFPALVDTLENVVIGIGMGWDLGGLVLEAQKALAIARGEVTP